MTLNELQPFIRYCRREQRYNPSITLCAPDHRIFFCLEGEISFTIGGKLYRLERDCLLYWHAGIPYRWHTPSGDCAELLCFNFDMTQCARSLCMPIPPESTPQPLLEEARFTDFPELNSTIFLREMHQLRALFSEIEKEYNERRLLWAPRTGAILSDILLRAVRELRAPRRFAADKTEEILSYIRRNYHLPLTNQMLGERLCYHPNYINRLIVAQTGTSLHRYLIDCRIRAAIELLETTNLPISDIGENVGFKDAAHFSKCFRRITGRSPSDYRVK